MTSVCGLLLPGMTLNATIFSDFPFPTISVEFNSAPPRPSEGPDLMSDYVAELNRQLDASTAWQRAERRIVIAHSFGGMLAQRWLSQDIQAARRVDGLLLMATTAGPMYDAVQIKLARVGSREIRLPLNRLMPLWNSALVTKTTKRIMTGGTLEVRNIDFRTITNPTDLKIDLAGWQNTDWRAMRAYRSAMNGFDVRKQLSQLTVRTIVLHGTDDALFPPSVAESLAGHLPNVELRRVDGARHVLPLTHGELVHRAALDLLNTQEKIPPG